MPINQQKEQNNKSIKHLRMGSIIEETDDKTFEIITGQDQKSKSFNV